MKIIRLLTPLRTVDSSKGKQFFMHKNYVDMFKKRNIELIFISPSCQETYQQLSKICDGLFLAGGLDIDACYFHESNHPENQLEIPEVDQMDFDLIALFNELHKPIIGICRGHQEINVAFGGTLYQDIASQYNTSINHNQNICEKYSHNIQVVKNSTLAQYFDHTTIVNSFHHQSIKDLAPDFHIMAYSEDGLIEAIEKDNIISVQWHPEKISDQNQEKILDMFLHLFV